MGAKLGGGGGALSEINMTPLIDIVLVVLIIMMVNLPIQIERMNVKAPGPKNPNPQPPDPNAEQLVIALYENGDIGLNRTAMDESKMLYEVGRRLRPMSKKQVFVDAAPGVEYGRVVDMIDLAREAGAAKVGLARMKEAGPASITKAASGSMPRGVHIGSPLVAGAVTEKQADSAYQKLKSRFEACYMQRLSMRRNLTGNISFRIEIGPDGQQMSDPVVKQNSTGDLDLKECMLPLMSEISFPALGDQKTAAIQYTLLLSPG